MEEFRRSCSHPSNIRFLGIWDTVKSVGYIRPKNLPHTRHNPIVQTVRHAVSLDERRSMYAMTTWGGLDADTRPATYVPASWGTHMAQRPPIEWQDVEEVWFAGSHADVGGGYAANVSSPADVSLKWMIDEAVSHGASVSDAGYRTMQHADRIVASHLHDELRRRGTWTDLFWRCLWTTLEHVPRWELSNEPPPPSRLFRARPAGPRALGHALREQVVTVHRTAEPCYPDAEAPWAGLPVRFVGALPASSSSGALPTCRPAT